MSQSVQQPHEHLCRVVIDLVLTKTNILTSGNLVYALKAIYGFEGVYKIIGCQCVSVYVSDIIRLPCIARIWTNKTAYDSFLDTASSRRVENRKN